MLKIVSVTPILATGLLLGGAQSQLHVLDAAVVFQNQSAYPSYQAEGGQLPAWLPWFPFPRPKPDTPMCRPMGCVQEKSERKLTAFPITKILMNDRHGPTEADIY